MVPGGLRRHPSARGPREQPGPHQERLAHLLDGVGLLPHGDGEGRDAHRATPEAHHQGLEDGAVEAVQPEVVDVVERERGTGHLAGHPAVGLDLGEVAHAAEQPVGDARCAPRAAGDLRGPVVGQLHAEQGGAAREHELQLGRLVELHLADEAEPVAQRSGEQAGAGGGPHEGERTDLQRDRGGAGPLADDDVDAEVLHRHVEQLFGGPGDAVDLVDEQDVARRQVRQHRGQVAGPLDRRAAGDLHGRAELRADDQREARLAESGRTGQQYVIRRAAPPLGPLEDERQLAGDLGLPDEVVQGVRPQGRLDDPLLVAGQRGDRGVLAEGGGHLPGQRPVEGGTHARPSSCSACRSRIAISTEPFAAICSSATGTSWAMAPSASFTLQPKPTRAEVSWSFHGATGVTEGKPAGAGPSREVSDVVTPSRSRSSRISRSAPFFPMPGTCIKALTSAMETARRTSRGGWMASTAWASRGPTPLAVCSSSNRLRSSSSANPYRVSESSRTIRLVDSRAFSPTWGRAMVPGVHWTARPMPPTSTTAPSGDTAATRPFTLAITALLPSHEAGASRGARLHRE